MCNLGDLKGRIGDRTRTGITDAFGVPGKNDNGRRVVEVCAERDSVWVTHFKHKSLHNYARVARGQDGVKIKSLIDLVLMKRDMLRYVQDVRAVRRMGRGTSDLHVVLCKVRLVGAWIKKREVVVRVRGIRSEKLREHQYREGYSKSLEGKGVEWDGDNNVEHMWEQIKRAMVESAREVCCSVRVGGKNPKSVWWNDEIKAAVSDEEAKERCMEAYREQKRKAKRCMNKHFGRNMNEDVNGNWKLSWKEGNNAKGGKLEQSKEGKWEIGTGGGRSTKDLEAVF